MIVFKCDKCHSKTVLKEFCQTGQDLINIITIPTLDNVMNKLTQSRSYQLCKKCTINLEVYLQPDPEAEEE